VSVVDGEVLAALQDQRVAIRAVQLGDGLPALNTFWVARDGDHILEDSVLGEHFEEPLAVY
jgi:hypothetical protein